MSTEQTRISISTLPHLEPVLAEELASLGAGQIEPGRRIVHCMGDKALIYKCNLHLRTALRVFVPIQTFNIRHSEELYKRARTIDWTSFLSPDATFAIEPNVHSIMFKHTNFASLRLKDAIADFFMEKFKRRPDVDPDNPDVLFNLHIDEHRVTISLDSSGESLNRRGYRLAGAHAPLNEVLAAGMILLTGWRGESDLYDAMCGSGTLAIEAAMIASATPPLILRQKFGFMTWKSFDADLWDDIKARAESGILKPAITIYASDVDKRQLETARLNINQAKPTTDIRLSLKDFFEVEPLAGKSVLVMNPPYGERLNEHEEVCHLYKRIGTQLKHHWQGQEAWILSSNAEALKNIGLKPARKFPLMNGPLECRFQKYELFGGKRSEHVAGIVGNIKNH